ncbi:MAG: hypothetical protein IJ109_02190 [Firmicutes bacterium]|nr:hypothetical protein [Bacillota bacterium]
MKRRTGIICIMMAVMVCVGCTAVPDASYAAAKKPAKVKFLKVTTDKNAKKIRASWKKVKSVKTYEVYVKAPGQSWKKAKKVRKNSAVYTVKAPGSYSVKVRAVKGKKKGKFSAVKQVTFQKSLWNNGQPVTEPSGENAQDQKTDPAGGSTSSGQADPTGGTSGPGSGTTQPVKVTAITVRGASTLEAGTTRTYQYRLEPSNATNPSVLWSIAGPSSTDGLTTKLTSEGYSITAAPTVASKKITLTARALDGSGVKGTLEINVVESPVRALKQVNLYPIYDNSIPSYSGIDQDKIDRLFRADNTVDPQYLMIWMDTDLKSVEGKYIWYNVTAGKKLGSVTESENSRAGRDHRSLLDVDYVDDDHGHGDLKRGGTLEAVRISDGEVVKGKNVIQLWKYTYSREEDYQCEGVVAEMTIDVRSKADAYTAFVDKTIKNAKNYSQKDWIYNNAVKTKGITKNEDLFYQLYCIEQFACNDREYWPGMYNGTSVAPLYTLATTGKSIDTGVGGCEDGAVLMTLACMRLGVKAEYYSKTGSLHKICAIEDSASVFGTAGVTFDAQPHLTEYSKMTTEEQYNAFVKTVKKIY